MSSDLVENLKAKLKEGSSKYKVFELLSDRAWHCRTCKGKKIASAQYAGGGGIPGLERRFDRLLKTHKKADFMVE
jgi:hypothetical protein